MAAQERVTIVDDVPLLDIQQSHVQTMADMLIPNHPPLPTTVAKSRHVAVSIVVGVEEPAIDAGKVRAGMTRPDAFMLGVVAFLAANCVSYFAWSQVPYATGWGMCPDSYDYMEVIGFPFVILSVVKTHTFFSLANLLFDLVVAILGSAFFAAGLAHRLPPLWNGHRRRLRYSLRGIFSAATIACICLGVAMVGPSWGLTIRNAVCLAVPAAFYAWFFYCRTVGWLRLATAATGLTLGAVMLAARYEDPFFFHDQIEDVFAAVVRGSDCLGVDEWNFTGLHFACLPIVRAIVLVFGSLSLIVLLHAAYHNYATYRR